VEARAAEASESLRTLSPAPRGSVRAARTLSPADRGSVRSVLTLPPADRGSVRSVLTLPPAGRGSVRAVLTVPPGVFKASPADGDGGPQRYWMVSASRKVGASLSSKASRSQKLPLSYLSPSEVPALIPLSRSRSLSLRVVLLPTFAFARNWSVSNRIPGSSASSRASADWEWPRRSSAPRSPSRRHA
jgi:hypothetical protein